MKKHSIDVRSIGEPWKAFIIDNAFTPYECEWLLQIAKSQGFSTEHTNKYGEKWRDDALRSNSSAYVKNAKVARFLYDRIASQLTGSQMSGSFGLNTHLRYNSFRAGEKIAPHVDGEFEGPGKVMSKLTFLLYLNDVIGGETRFLNAETMNHIDVLPAQGRVLIFDQRLCHAALPVKGRYSCKYTLRSDVLY